MNAPSIEYGVLAPMLIVFGAAVVSVLVEAFLSESVRFVSQLGVAVAGLVAAFVAVVVLAGSLGDDGGQFAALGSVVIDGPALFLQGTILLISIAALLLIAERGGIASRGDIPGLDGFTPQASAVPGSVAEREATTLGIRQTEVFPLALLAVAGMLLFPASGDLLTMFVALEVFSLPLYLLCGLARRRRLLSQEAALKYFLLGAFSSAFFLYGTALLYGYSGTTDLSGIGAAIATEAQGPVLVLTGTALLSVGLLFKVGAVPFHSWIPDVYQGAPTPITAFMSAATKVAAFGAMLRIFSVALPELKDDWRPMLWAVAILTMAVGAILAVTQSDVKRMLAYSSVAHVGFVLTGVIAADREGIAATLFYLVAYGFTALGAFAIVGLVRDGDGEVAGIDRWAGIGRTSPVLGTVFAVFLLAMAGIPLTSGFVAKFAVFQAAVEGGAVPLVIVGVLSSAIAAFFYVRVIVLMFFTEPNGDEPDVVTPGAGTIGAIGFAAALTVALGVWPQPLLNLADNAAVFFS
ncbi:NADH-quinone oxidoreductase subunit NuoN [Rhodococcus sp. NPDC058521]|uniref:NADH-quinone oxidoreductase subunit NuoN n=1 Tax=Rhodococcus sp. NPDC058521 TaxID=3346536 RepID=UPI003649C308